MELGPNVHDIASVETTGKDYNLELYFGERWPYTDQFAIHHSFLE